MIYETNMHGRTDRQIDGWTSVQIGRPQLYPNNTRPISYSLITHSSISNPSTRPNTYSLITHSSISNPSTRPIIDRRHECHRRRVTLKDNRTAQPPDPPSIIRSWFTPIICLASSARVAALEEGCLEHWRTFQKFREGSLINAEMYHLPGCVCDDW